MITFKKLKKILDNISEIYFMYNVEYNTLRKISDSTTYCKYSKGGTMYKPYGILYPGILIEKEIKASRGDYCSNNNPEYTYMFSKADECLSIITEDYVTYILKKKPFYKIYLTFDTSRYNTPLCHIGYVICDNNHRIFVNVAIERYWNISLESDELSYYLDIEVINKNSTGCVYHLYNKDPFLLCDLIQDDTLLDDCVFFKLNTTDLQKINKLI